MNRRHILLGGVAAAIAGASNTVAAPTFAKKSLPVSIEHLRKAMLNADERALQALVSENVSFGHSNGLIQTREQFIANLVNKVEVFHTLRFTHRDVHDYGQIAHERHKFNSDLTFGGKRFAIELDVLQVWGKENGVWKLFARQAFKA